MAAAPIFPNERGAKLFSFVTMRKWIHFVLLVGLVMGMTMGGTMPMLGQSNASVMLDAPNVEQLWTRAFWHEQHTGKTMQGEILPANWDFFEEATLLSQDESLVWTLRIHVENAPALCVYFDSFHLPVGGQLSFRSEAGRFTEDFVEGPVDFTENNDHGRWVSGEVPGEEVVIVYSQPSSTIGTPDLHISGVGYFFRMLWLEGEYDLLSENNRGSDPCQVDVMCPEGEDWQCQRDAVVRLRISMGGGIYLCSGAMVNNTALDCRQLLLSSFHCADDMSESDWGFLKVRYNYEHFDCGGTSSFNSHIRTGVFLLTSSDDISANGNINGSDFLLMEVEDPIFDSWTPFYAGWDVTGSVSTSGVGIHHPSGDRKKISTYTSNLANSSAYFPGAHWRVYWEETETEHGVTEGGSSGSPLYDEDGRIVGTLTGGASFCDSPNAPDYYGKMSFHWDGNNPIDDDEKLEFFLDPLGTGQQVLDGSYATEEESPCAEQTVCGIVEVEELWLMENEWTLRPNPAREQLTIDWSGEIQATEIQIFDASGRKILRTDVRKMTTPTVSLTGLESGMYFLTLFTPSGASATRKFLIE